METLLKYFIGYIDSFNKIKCEKQQEKFAYNIIKIILFVNSMKKNKYTSEFNKIYKKLDNKKIYEIYESMSSYEKSFDEKEKFDLNEFEYIKNITKYISTNDELIYERNGNMTSLENYIGKINYEYYMNKVDIIVSHNIESCCLYLFDTNLIFIEKFDIPTILHEIMHVNKFHEKYSEFASILAELSYCSYYKIGDSGYRLNDIEYIKRLSSSKFRKNNREKYIVEFEYCLGTLLSIPFIYKNGNSFKNVEEVIKIINNYQDNDIFYIMNKLNLSNSDIIDGFKNYRKILTKGE